MVRMILSPPLVSFCLALVLVLTEVHLPSALMEAFHYLGNMVTPLSMLFIGYTLSTVDIKALHFGKEINLVLLGRFIVAPVSALLFSRLFALPEMMTIVFVTLSALPAMAQVPILAAVYGADTKYGAVVVSITTLLCIIVIPVYLYFLV